MVQPFTEVRGPEKEEDAEEDEEVVEDVDVEDKDVGELVMVILSLLPKSLESLFVVERKDGTDDRDVAEEEEEEEEEEDEEEEVSKKFEVVVVVVVVVVMVAVVVVVAMVVVEVSTSSKSLPKLSESLLSVKL